MAAGRFERGKNTVRSRDSGLRLIETSQDIYILYNAAELGEDYRTFKTKAKKQIIRGILPQGLHNAVATDAG